MQELRRAKPEVGPPARQREVPGADARRRGAHHLFVQRAVVEVRHRAQLGAELPQPPGERQGDEEERADAAGRGRCGMAPPQAVDPTPSGRIGPGADWYHGISCSTVVMAHHDADLRAPCLIALENLEELLIGTDEIGGVATGEDGASARWMLQNAVGGAAQCDDPCA